LNLLDEVASEYDKFTLVPYSDISAAVPNAPVLFNVVPDLGFTPVSTSTAFEATCWVKSNPNKTIPCLIRETPDQRIEVRFVPPVRDVYVLDVKQSNHSIKKSPQEVPLTAIELAKEMPEQSNMRVSVQVEEKTSQVKLPFKFQIIFAQVPDPKLITAKVTDPTGKLLPIDYAPQYSSGFIEVLLTPENQGTHKINLFYEGTVISGTSPFQTNPEPYAYIVGDQERNDAYPGDDYLVKMNTINCKIADFKFALKGPASHGAKGNPVVVASLGLDPSKDQGIGVKFYKDNQPANPNGTENGSWDIKFNTKFSGQYTLLVFHHANPIKGCPVTINAAIENSRAFGTGPVKVTLCTDPDQNEQFGYTSPRNEPVQISAKSVASTGPVQISAKPTGPVTITATPTSSGNSTQPSDKIHRSHSKDKSTERVHRSGKDKGHRSHRDKTEKK